MTYCRDRIFVAILPTLMTKKQSILYWLLLSFSIVSMGIVISLILTRNDITNAVTVPNEEFELITSPSQKAHLLYELYKYDNGAGVKSYRRVSETIHEFDLRGKLISSEDNVLVLDYPNGGDSIEVAYNFKTLVLLGPADVAVAGFDNKSLSPFVGKYVHVIAIMNEDGALVAKSFGFASLGGSDAAN